MSLFWEFRPAENPDHGISPLEGSRGSGANAGERGIGYFQAGYYPACSKHGAMSCVKGNSREPLSYWRCLAEGCNIGSIWTGVASL